MLMLLFWVVTPRVDAASVSPQHRYYPPSGPHGDTTQTNIDNTAIVASTSNFVVAKSILLKQQLKNYEMGWPVMI
jgi:hypothetical protein